jgi:hypothetical protein
VFVLLYWHAYRQRAALDLNELEVFDTRVDVQESALNVAIGALSMTVAALGGARLASLAGFTYMLCPIILSVHGTMMRRRRRRIENEFELERKSSVESDG